MNAALIAAAAGLAAILSRENAALDSMDLARAAAMLPEKQLAVAEFEAALRAAAGHGAGDAQSRQRAEETASRLKALATENRRLLERGLRVQGRVLATVVRALPRVCAPVARYCAGGAFAADRRTPPALVSARV